MPGLAQDWLLPATTLVDVATGRTVRLDRLDKPMLVNFWASWCAPCLQEIPDLVALANDPALGVQIVGVAMESGDRAAIQAFADRHKMHYRLLRATDDDLVPRYDLPGLPITLVVNGDGVVRRRLMGVQTRAAFEAAIRATMTTPTTQAQ